MLVIQIVCWCIVLRVVVHKNTSNPVALCKSKLVTTDETVSELTQANLSEGTDLSLKSFPRSIVAEH